eukprot:4463295-Pyramimonas_sp.AAC.3
MMYTRTGTAMKTGPEGLPSPRLPSRLSQDSSEDPFDLEPLNADGPQLLAATEHEGYDDGSDEP